MTDTFLSPHTTNLSRDVDGRGSSIGSSNRGLRDATVDTVNGRTA